VALEPSAGAGAVRQYFSAHKVADAKTDITADEPWAFLAVRPPVPKPPISLPESVMSEWKRLQQSPSLTALMQRLSAETALTEVEALPTLFRRELPALFERYPNGSLCYVGVDAVLLKRLTCMRLALQLEVAPDTPVGKNNSEGITYFGAHQLTGGVNFAEAVQPIRSSPGAR
jgi:hypothetical protein